MTEPIMAVFIQGVGGVYLFQWENGWYHACYSKQTDEDGRHVCHGYVITTDDRQEAFDAFKAAERQLRERVEVTA